jgi:hypothetical protein
VQLGEPGYEVEPLWAESAFWIELPRVYFAKTRKTKIAASPMMISNPKNVIRRATALSCRRVLCFHARHSSSGITCSCSTTVSIRVSSFQSETREKYSQQEAGWAGCLFAFFSERIRRHPPRCRVVVNQCGSFRIAGRIPRGSLTCANDDSFSLPRGIGEITAPEPIPVT